MQRGWEDADAGAGAGRRRRRHRRPEFLLLECIAKSLATEEQVVRFLFRLGLELELENNKLEVELETEDGNETELEAPLPHSKRADEDQTGKPVWAAPFVGLTISDTWWTPVRESLLSYLRLPSEAPLFLSNTHSNPNSNGNADTNAK